ncbi:MAG: hypothetical protein QM758_15770 [Armatimonas sp.]
MRQEYASKTPEVRLGKILTIKLPPEQPVTGAEAAHIKKLIQQLARIDRRDFGLPPSLREKAFAPVTGSESVDRIAVAGHDQQHVAPLVELVCIGPRALPFLLESLEDTTPTRLIVMLGGMLTGIDFSNEMWGNLANGREQKILSLKPVRESNRPFVKEPLDSHTVTIGDVCFIIVGQIVGRQYLAVRGQPSSGVVINSPTRDPSIVQAVRAIWTSDDPTQHILDSLLLDYATRGIHHGGKNESFDNWYVGSTPQIPAVMRLLYYFPRQMAPIAAQRLRSLQVQATRLNKGEDRSDADMTRWVKRELANEVSTRDFIKAVSWCKEPEIHASLRSIFQKTDDPELLLAALPALHPMQNWLLIEQRFRELINRLQYSEGGWYGDGYNALIALRKIGGSRVLPLYRQYLRGASAQRCLSVCEALSNTEGNWDREFLWPMLADKRNSTGYSHPVNDRENARRLPIRVCDQAAEVIAKHRKDLAFTMVGTKKELDRQIGQIQLLLKRGVK